MTHQVRLDVVITKGEYIVGISRQIELPFVPFVGLNLYGLRQNPDDELSVESVGYDILSSTFTCTFPLDELHWDETPSGAIDSYGPGWAAQEGVRHEAIGTEGSTACPPPLDRPAAETTETRNRMTDLDDVSDLAREYAAVALRDDRNERPQAKALVSRAKEFSALQMAYFCQQVVSHCPDTAGACAVLTAFTNRLVFVNE